MVSKDLSVFNSKPEGLKTTSNRSFYDFSFIFLLHVGFLHAKSLFPLFWLVSLECKFNLFAPSQLALAPFICSLAGRMVLDMPWMQLKFSNFPSLTCYYWQGNVADSIFFFPRSANVPLCWSFSQVCRSSPQSVGGHRHNCTNYWLTQQLATTSFSFFTLFFIAAVLRCRSSIQLNFYARNTFFFFTLTLSLYLSIWLKSDFMSHLAPSSSFALLLKGALSGHFLSLKWNLSPLLVLATQADKHRFKNVQQKQETEQSVTYSLQFLPSMCLIMGLTFVPGVLWAFFPGNKNSWRLRGCSLIFHRHKISTEFCTSKQAFFFYNCTKVQLLFESLKNLKMNPALS